MDAKELLERYAKGDWEFSDADLSLADLGDTDLGGADLGNFCLAGANLGGADLSHANLNRANLRGANFRMSRLRGTDLSTASLRGANLYGADLSYSNLFGADLSEAKVSWANLSGANLTAAELIGADLSGASLHEAKLDAVRLASSLLDLDLGPLCRVRVHHHGPSNVNWRTIAKSLRAPKLKEFLVASGMPPVFVEYMVDCAHAHQGSLFDMMQSTFISYGGPDEAFARKLHEALHSNGVTTFFFPEHAVPGAKLHRLMHEGINKHDRVILICSEASLNRPGVLNEIEETLAREAHDGGAAYLIPIRLDNYLFSKDWNPPNPDVVRRLRERVVADFRGTRSNETKFTAQLMRLLDALKKKRPAPTINVPAAKKPAAKKPAAKKPAAKKPAAKKPAAKKKP